MCRAAGLLCRNKQRIVGKALIELPEVVEGHTRRGQGGQTGLHLGIALIAQHAKAQAFAGDVAQLLFDRLDRGRHVRRRGQFDREQAGKPAHGAGQVDGLKQVFTAVTFQLNQR